MPRSRKTLIAFVPAATLIGLALFLAGRFWLAPDPSVPSFTPAQKVRFDPMASFAVIGPQPWVLSGRLLDETGAPVADALLYARPSGVPSWTLSGADGAFELSWPSAAGPDQVPDLDAPALVDLVVAAWGFLPTTFQVGPGREQLVLTLPPRQEAQTSLPPVERAPLAGSVRRPAGLRNSSESAYEIQFLPESPPQVFAGAVARRVSCGTDGSFAFPDLAHGRYRLQVFPAWAEGGSWPGLLGAEPPSYTHPPDRDEALVLALEVGAIAGLALDTNGEPVEGALILLSDAQVPAHLWPPASSDPSGAFRFDDLPGGSYLVAVRAGEARPPPLRVEVSAGSRVQLSLPPLRVREEE